MPVIRHLFQNDFLSLQGSDSVTFSAIQCFGPYPLLTVTKYKNLSGKRVQECLLLFSEDGISHYCHLVFGLCPLSWCLKIKEIVWLKGWAKTYTIGPCITCLLLAPSVRKINLHKQLGWLSMMNLLDSVCILYYQLVRVI